VQIPRQVAKSPAAWSPDGSELAFIDCPNFACAIYVMKADGTNLRQLTDGATLQGLGIDLSWR
jgi:Tol biopolymer transport system component